MAVDPEEARLSEWLDGRLPADEAEELAAAVRSDPRLEAVVDELRGVRRLLASASSPPAADPAFVDAVTAAVAALSADANVAVDPAVDEEWQRLERERIEQERAEAREEIGASPVADATSTQHRPSAWLATALAAALAAGVLVAVVINKPWEPGPELAQAVPDRADARVPEALVGVNEIDPDAIAARMLARGIEITPERSPPGVLRVTVRLRDDEGRQRFEELLASSRVRLDRDELRRGRPEIDARRKASDVAEPDDAAAVVERIGCLGRAAAVDRLLESLAVSSGSVVLEQGTLSPNAAVRLESRGPAAEGVLAVADARAEEAAEAEKAADKPPELGADPARQLAATQEMPAAASASSRELLSRNHAVDTANAVDMAAERSRLDRYREVIPPEGFIRLWIDIIDESRPAKGVQPPTGNPG